MAYSEDRLLRAGTLSWRHKGGATYLSKIFGYLLTNNVNK